MATISANKFGFRHLVKPEWSDCEQAARPSDGLVVFGAMWGFATMLSIADRTRVLSFEWGVMLGIAQWTVMFMALALVARPRFTLLLGLVAGAMAVQYVARLPVLSNNQTLAFFMNISIVAVIGLEVIKSRSLTIDREIVYERLRVVARAILATMYFYGIFHKINTDFLDPEVSCAVALYEPLARPFSLDQNMVGQWGSIIATFVVEAIAIVCLYWRRYFWVGLILGLTFHYIIPLSGYSWYMDFSSLVLALYMLSVPREVSAGFYSSVTALLRKAPISRAGFTAILLFVALVAVCALIVFRIADYFPTRENKLVWHSAWLLIWAVVGGTMSVLITRAALLALPYSEKPGPRQPRWLLIAPAILFIQCLSPYFGLKTESSINMFSNLHTEGGQTNHLIFTPPPYVAGYQRELVKVVDSSIPWVATVAKDGDYLVRHELGSALRENPGGWVTFDYKGQRYERIVNETFPFDRPNLLERKLLRFKPVDFERPKVCTH
ncbi:thiol-disulfide oxidoreductase [Sphingomonas sp. LHG3406-1]|uniref:thiol-disulfide oxidoreductase n=1 Tax=Sphingomonas sp. LHG3406-1 TaxID=2804617 RepID=UPI00262140D5|nr:thiol-disulfide oxidoreductase [Sphingomonas sp. LHG3406-1]